MLDRELKRIEGLEVQRDISLASLTTFKIGGPARYLILPGTVTALEKVLLFLKEKGLPFRILGQGSNLLISERGEEIVLSLRHMKRIQMTRRAVIIEAGCRLSRLIAWALSHSLAGMEGLCGIPASIGGALFMNAGTKSVSMGGLASKALLTGPGESHWVPVKRLGLGYRKSHLPPGQVVSAVEIPLGTPSSEGRKTWQGGSSMGGALIPSDTRSIRQRIRRIMGKRISTQPLGQPSPGCVFKNPAECSAGKLIEDCGLKGISVGDAAISKIHANFVINRGNATSLQVVELMEIVKSQVKDATGIDLEPEVTIWNSNGE